MIFEPIESDRLVVRELSEGDREGLMKFVREPEQLRYMLFSMKTAGDADGFIGLAKKTAVDAARRDYYMAVDAKTESGRGYIGSVSLMGDEEGASAELGYSITARSGERATPSRRRVSSWTSASGNSGFTASGESATRRTPRRPASWNGSAWSARESCGNTRGWATIIGRASCTVSSTANGKP